MSFTERLKKLSGIEDEADLEKLKAVRLRVTDFIQALFLAIIAAFIIKTFAIEAYRIPTGSMEKTLLVGDFLLVNKFIYGAASPRTLPFTNIRIPYFKMPALREPQRNDVVVFEYPGARDQFKPDEPVNYIKRLIGLPGDTVVIVNKVVYVNGKEMPRPPKIQYLNPFIRPLGREESRIFPRGEVWNEDNYGPLIIPQKGTVISLNLQNIEKWRTIINREEGKEAVQVIGRDILLDGRPLKSYTLKNDYYFMMGDNRDDSWDSRFWGVVSRDRIIGKGLIIYWSWDPEFNNILEMFNNIRWGRIAKVVK